MLKLEAGRKKPPEMRQARRWRGRMPPRLGAWQPKKATLRCGAATNCPARIVAAREETGGLQYPDQASLARRVRRAARSTARERSRRGDNFSRSTTSL